MAHTSFFPVCTAVSTTDYGSILSFQTIFYLDELNLCHCYFYINVHYVLTGQDATFCNILQSLYRCMGSEPNKALVTHVTTLFPPSSSQTRTTPFTVFKPFLFQLHVKQKPQLKLHKDIIFTHQTKYFFTKELVTNRYLFALYFPLNYECMYNYVISLSRIPIPINKEIWPIVCEILVLLPLPSGCFPVFVSCNFLGGVGSQICERIFLHTSLKLFTQQSTLST